MAKDGGDEKADGLEIIAIGKLYNGPWDKKYWSSSRGKDRYPFPVGYRAVRTQNGITYTMEINEGLKGPIFLISSTDGQSCSGQTPDIVWESFQKKGCTRLKLWHGKRFSCKIDGVELFGFKNPFVQRLLRELVSNVSVIEECRLLSSNFNDLTSGTGHHFHSQCTEGCTGSCTCTDVQPNMGKSQVKRKRRTKDNVINLKSIKEAKPKRSQPGNQAHSVSVSNSGQSSPGNHTDTYPSTSPTSREEKVNLESLVADGNNSLLAENGLHFDSSKSCEHLAVQGNGNHFNAKCSKDTNEAIILFKDEELLDNAKFTNRQGFSFSKQVEDAVETLVAKDSETMNDMDLCAPDTLDISLDGTHDSVLDNPKESPDNIEDELNSSHMLIADDSINESQAEEMVMSTANDNSEKCDTDSVGQEIAKSMMTVLLPRALPLLKTFSRKKKSTIKSAKVSHRGMRSQEGKEGTNLSTDVASPAELLIEDLNVGMQKEKANTSSKDLCEDSTSIAPDSFESEQCESTESIHQSLFQGVAEADQSGLRLHTCVHENVELPVNNGLQQAEASDSIKTFCPKVHLVLENGAQRDENVSAGFTSGSPSTSRNDECIDSNNNSLHHEIHSEQKNVNMSGHPTEGTFLIDNATSSGVVCFDQIALKESSARTAKSGSSNLPVISLPDIANSTRHCSAPPSKISVSRNVRDVLAPKTSSANEPIPASKNFQVICSHSRVEKDSIFDEAKFDLQPQSFQNGKGSSISKGAFCNAATVTSDQETVLPSNYNETSDRFNAHVPCQRKPQAPSSKEPLGGDSQIDLSIIRLQEEGARNGNMTETDTINYSNLNTSIGLEHKSELEDALDLLGCYVHPMPISLVLLRTKGNEMCICVLCGYCSEKEKSVFIYKVPFEGKRRGCPSIIGHASMVSPISDASGREITLDSSSLQLTPDGQCLVISNIIKAPYCRAGNVSCPCSVCTSECFEENAVKIVQVKLGYVSVVLKLSTTESICSILVCEPSYLVAAEKSGKVHLWTMNSSWTDSTEESYLPTSDCMPSFIVMMKKIPKDAALVVGLNTFGEFCLWDVSKRILVSKFSAARTTVLHFIPVSLYRMPRAGFVTAGIGSKEHINSIMNETKTWSSEGSVNHGFLPMQSEDVAICLLVSTISNSNAEHGYQSNDSGVSPVACWSLALLAKNTVILGNTLDSRAAVIGASAGYGIMFTCAEQLYVWELSKGSKLGELPYCKGTKVTCIAADDSGSGAFAIACDGGQLQVYLHSARTSTNQEKDK